MNNLRKTIFFCFLIFFQFSANLYSSEEKIFAIDMDLLLKKSLAGQSISKQLNSIQEKNNKYFSKEEKTLKKKEKEIVDQKNILSKEELNKKILVLKDEVNAMNLEKKKRRSSFNNTKNKLIQNFLTQINPIITEYAKKNNISMIIDQKNLIISKNEINITDKILKQLDDKIKKIKIN